MSTTSPELKPLLVSVKAARVMLGGISNNKFWAYVRQYDIELVGTPRKRWAVVESIERAVEAMRQQPPTDKRKRTKQSPASVQLDRQ